MKEFIKVVFVGLLILGAMASCDDYCGSGLSQDLLGDCK